MVKESEQVQDQVFGDFKILLIEDDQKKKKAIKKYNLS